MVGRVGVRIVYRKGVVSPFICPCKCLVRVQFTQGAKIYAEVFCMKFILLAKKDGETVTHELTYPNEWIAIIEIKMFALVHGYTLYALHDAKMRAIYHSQFGIIC